MGASHTPFRFPYYEHKDNFHFDPVEKTLLLVTRHSSNDTDILFIDIYFFTGYSFNGDESTDNLNRSSCCKEVTDNQTGLSPEIINL